MDIEINEVQEIIKNLESSGELSIKEEKHLKIAKLCVQLAAENVVLKAAVAEEIEVINRGGQRYCVKEGMSINPIYARGWNDHRANLTAVETPATDRIVAGIKVDGVEEFAAYCGEENSVFVEAKAHYRSLPDAAYEFCSMLRENKSEGVKS